MIDWLIDDWLIDDWWLMIDIACCISVVAKDLIRPYIQQLIGGEYKQCSFSFLLLMHYIPNVLECMASV